MMIVFVAMLKWLMRGGDDRSNLVCLMLKRVHITASAERLML